MDTIDRFLFSDEPQVDESFIGYLLRLVELNDYDTVSWILQLAGIKDYSHSKFGFVFNPSVVLSPLSRLTGVEESKLTPLLYQPVKEPGQVIAVCHSVFGLSVPQYLIRPRHPKVCPTCLRESAYARKAWELTPITVCPIHKTLLLDECPRCKNHINWSRTSVSKCACEFDWRKLKPGVVEDSELTVTRQIYRLFGLPLGTAESECLNADNPLYNLGLEQFLSVILFIAGQYEGLIDTKGKKLAPSRRNDEIHKLFCRAFDAFNDWPNNYFAFLDWRRDSIPDTRHTHGLRRDFNQYKYALYVRLGADCYRFMRDTFEKYITGHWNGGYMTSLTRLNDEARRGKKYFSQAEVAKRVLKISPKYIKGLVSAGKLIAVERQHAGRKIVLIEAESVWRLKEKLQNRCYLAQVEANLGLHARRVMELVEHGLLTPLRGPTIDGCSDWTFDSEEVAALLDNLERRVTNDAPSSKYATITFYGALRTLKRVKVKFVSFVKDILDGQITPCRKRGDDGLQDFVFRHRDIAGYLHAKLCALEGDVLTMREAAKALNINIETAYYFARRNLLRARVSPRVKAMGLLVKRKDLELFDSTYISLSSIAKQQGANSKYLLEFLNSKGVKPVFEIPKVGISHIHLFKKKEVESINLAVLIPVEGSKWVNGTGTSSKKEKGAWLNSPSILDERQVAVALGIDVETVRQLVERGALKPLKRLSLDKQKLFFSRYIVETYKNKSVTHIGLIAFVATANLFNLLPVSFYNKFVRTGRLKPVIDSGRRSEHFFRMDDVETILEVEEQTIITPEAVEILRVDASCINKMIASGRLKPISGPSVDGFGKNLFLRSDVEKLSAEREAFKSKCAKEGKTTRYGRPHRNLSLSI